MWNRKWLVGCCTKAECNSRAMTDPASFAFNVCCHSSCTHAGLLTELESLDRPHHPQTPAHCCPGPFKHICGSSRGCPKPPSAPHAGPYIL
jgi:hypothetical protein